jgi:acetolactate synthase-1/2/3 large subunit
VSVRADARRFAEALAARLAAENAIPADTWDLPALRAWAKEQLLPLRPQLEYLDAIRRALPEDGVFVSEYTQVGYVASVAFPTFAPNTFISPGYQGTLGYGFATALGAQVGAGARSVVSVTGDGGFAWTLSELATAKREGVPLVTIVFNDGFYGNVRRIQEEEFGGRYIASELTNPDFVALAAAYGVDAVRVEGAGALADALGAAIAARRPTLIEVPVGEFPSPWGLIDAL